MKVFYILHSGFLIETEKSYYLFDYYRGALPALKGAYVFSDSCSSELLVGRVSGGKLKVDSIDSGIAPGYGTIASFGEDEDNELWFVNHENGGVYRIR